MAIISLFMLFQIEVSIAAVDIVDPEPQILCNNYIANFTELENIPGMKGFLSSMPSIEFIRQYSLDLSYLCVSKSIDRENDQRHIAKFLSCSYSFITHGYLLYDELQYFYHVYDREFSLGFLHKIRSDLKNILQDYLCHKEINVDHPEIVESIKNMELSYSDLCFLGYSIFDVVANSESNLCRKAEIYKHLVYWAEICGDRDKLDFYKKEYNMTAYLCDYNIKHADMLVKKAQDLINKYQYSISYFKMKNLATSLNLIDEARKSYELIGKSQEENLLKEKQAKIYEEYRTAEHSFFIIVETFVAIIFLCILIVLFLYMQYRLRRMSGEELASF